METKLDKPRIIRSTYWQKKVLPAIAAGIGILALSGCEYMKEVLYCMTTPNSCEENETAK